MGKIYVGGEYRHPDPTNCARTVIVKAVTDDFVIVQAREAQHVIQRQVFEATSELVVSYVNGRYLYGNWLADGRRVVQGSTKTLVGRSQQFWFIDLDTAEDV